MLNTGKGALHMTLSGIILLCLALFGPVALWIWMNSRSEAAVTGCIGCGECMRTGECTQVRKGRKNGGKAAASILTNGTKQI